MPLRALNVSDQGDKTAWKANIAQAPFLVRLSLWGIKTRASAMFFVVASLLLAVVCWIWVEAWIAIAFFLAAATYYYAMAWVDKNG